MGGYIFPIVPPRSGESFRVHNDSNLQEKVLAPAEGSYRLSFGGGERLFSPNESASPQSSKHLWLSLCDMGFVFTVVTVLYVVYLT